MTAGPLTLPASGTSRTPLRIDVDRGRIETAGQRARFDPEAPDAALIAYLKLVRKLRDVEREPSFVLRRDDVVVIAGALRQDAVVVLDRLGELMGATVTQRRSMVTAFLAGALMIAVATGATALAPGDGRGPAPAPTSGERSDVVASAPAEEDAVGPTRSPREGAGVGVGLPRTSEPAATGGPGATSATGSAAPAGPAPVSSRPVPSPTAGDVGRVTTPAPTPATPAPAPRADVGTRTPQVERPAPTRPDREIIQPGATIDIPIDEVDVPVTTPVVEQPDEPTPPVGPPSDVTPPVGPPSDVTPPVGPPSDVTPPVGPPSDVTPPVGPPADVTPPVDGDQGNGNQGQGNGNQGQGNQGQGNQGQGNSGVGQGGGGGNGTGNEGQGVGPR